MPSEITQTASRAVSTTFTKPSPTVSTPVTPENSEASRIYNERARNIEAVSRSETGDLNERSTTNDAPNLSNNSTPSEGGRGEKLNLLA